jgi:ribonuclease Z
LKGLQQGKSIEHKGKKIDVSKYTNLVKGKKIAFIFDTAYNENCLKIAKDADVLISEACFSEEDEKLAEERDHLTDAQAATIAKKSKVNKLILTHVSQRYPSKKIIVDEAKKIFKNTELAHDFMSVEI